MVLNDLHFLLLCTSPSPIFVSSNWHSINLFMLTVCNNFLHWAACHVPHVIRFGTELDSCTHKSIWFRLELKHLGPVSWSQSCDLLVSAFSLRIFTLLDFYAHVRQTTAWWKQKEVPQDVPPAKDPPLPHRVPSPHLAHHFYSIHNIAGGLPTWPRNCRKTTPRSTQSTWPSVFINEY